jgi:hypothetical protein
MRFRGTLPIALAWAVLCPAHAFTTTSEPAPGGFAIVGANGAASIGFEDVLGGGERDFKDFAFRPTNVFDPLPTVPHPGTLALIGLGLAGVSSFRQKRHLR